MKRLYKMVLIVLLLTLSCTEEDPDQSNPNKGEPNNATMLPNDMGGGERDMKSSQDMMEEDQDSNTTLRRGKKIADFSDIEFQIEKVVLRESGSKIFLVINESRLLFTESEKVDLTSFYTWPDATIRAAAGKISRDISVGPDRLWFVGQRSNNAAAIFGASYVPDEPETKTFGDPVVIFDAGPGKTFTGVGSFRNIIAAGIRGEGGESDRIVFVQESTKNITVKVPGFHSKSTFRMASYGGVYAYDNSIWKINFDSKKVKRLTTTGKVRDIRTTDRFLYLKTDTGLGKLAVDCIEPCVPEKLTEGFSPQNWDANDVRVAWNEGEVIRTYDGKLSSIAKADAPVLSILVKGDSIYWATKDGLYVLK